MSAPRLDWTISDPVPGLRLLIVEDEPALRQMLAWDFEDFGYRVEAVGSYREALLALARDDYQFALLDYRLPDGNGQDLLALIGDLQPQIRAVLISGELSERRTREARLAGARAVLAKPVSVRQLDRLFRP
jgi:DNA-binding NtrC family response regulator